MAKNKEDDNLTRCSNEALAAGMTYGKYMALKYEKEQPTKRAHQRSAEEKASPEARCE